jgi:aminoglycoside phosphotransferase (APT) family kinase protein
VTNHAVNAFFACSASSSSRISARRLRCRASFALTTPADAQPGHQIRSQPAMPFGMVLQVIGTERDPQRTQSAIRTWLTKVIEETSDIEISEVSSPSANGGSSETLLFDAAWRKGSQRESQGFALRLRPSGHTVFLETRFEEQYQLLRALGDRTDVPVPRILHFESDPSYLGGPFIAMERVDGRVPSDSPPHSIAGWLKDAGPAEQEELWWSGLEAMAGVHRVDPEAVGLSFLDRPSRGANGFDQELDYYREFYEWGQAGVRSPTIEAAFDWLGAHRPTDESATRLCWGCARIGNMIFDGFACRAVLDWEMAWLGDPTSDLCRWLWSDRFFSEGIGGSRLPGFPSREKTIARWEELVGRSVRSLEVYDVFAGLRTCVIGLRIGNLNAAAAHAVPDPEALTNTAGTRLLARVLTEADGGTAC